MRRTVLALILIFPLPFPLYAADNRPQAFADIHLHYNWDQEELVEPAQAVSILQEHHVTLAVVFSTPTRNALKITGNKNLRVIHFFSPYVSAYRRSGWFHDDTVLKLAREGLADGTYAGIGEVHVISGLGPRRDNRVLQGLLKLAAEFNVPFNIHTEASSYAFFKPVCQQYPKVRFLWAHAGGILGPKHAVSILQACPNVWLEVSARDPWHYGGLVDEKGKLRSQWRQVILKYPERFMVGTDPVWHAHQRDRWYEADEGWLHYADFINFHRKWLAELPDEIEAKVRLHNAEKFFTPINRSKD